MADTENNIYSPFLKLPPEVRIRIYEYLWPGSASLEIIVSSQSTRVVEHSRPPRYKPSLTRHYNALATLSVSKAVRSEALLVFYEKAHFHVRIYEGNLWITTPLAEPEAVLQHIRSSKVSMSLPSRPHYYQEGVHDRLLTALGLLSDGLNSRAQSQPLSICIMSSKQVTDENCDLLRKVQWRGGILLEVGFGDRTQPWDEAELGTIIDHMGRIVKEDLQG